MPQVPDSIPQFPPLLAKATGLLPLMPLSLSLTAYSKAIARQHPGLFRRLGEFGHARFILDPTDLPFVLSLEPGGGTPRVTVTRTKGAGDALIAGPLAALLGLVHGAYDGDALFFSRDLVIEGDTGAALALRNAVDDAELDLAQDFQKMSGPWGPIIKKLIGLAEHRTGVCLSRPDEEAAW